MSAYYNEIDGYAAQWLRNLIAAGLIAPGDVDERSIVEARPADLAGYRQCHFFAGIGGWSYALRLAGWPDDRPVWTGSCPCQPFSNAGRKKGFSDDRHLWPEWHRLIRECRPATIFGEQVEGATDWLALVRSDLDAMGYAVGCLPIEAASAGADHFRDRYWFVADRDRERYQIQFCECGNIIPECEAAARDRLCLLAHSYLAELRRKPPAREQPHAQQNTGHCDSAVADRESLGCRRRGGSVASLHPATEPKGYDAGVLADREGERWGAGWTDEALRQWGPSAAVCSVNGRQIIECPDGKWRRLPPPRVRWLGTRLPARIPRVRAFGNAIDPRPAAEFISAWMSLAP